MERKSGKTTIFPVVALHVHDVRYKIPNDLTPQQVISQQMFTVSVVG